MARQPYFPASDGGILTMLTSFATNATNNGAALQTKYNLSDDDVARVLQASVVWAWFMGQLDAVRNAAQGLTQTRDRMFTGSGAMEVIQTIIQLASVPNHLNAGTLEPSLLDPGFFLWFQNLVQTIKDNANYLVDDGVQLGIEGPQIPAPDPGIVPLLTGELLGSGEPQTTCKKGVFQGYDVHLTRPGMARRKVGFATSRHWTCEEPLPAAGTAEVWTFEVQYRYQNAPFGQMSQPLLLTVRGH